MGKRILISEEEKNHIRGLYLLTEKKQDDKERFCHAKNTKQLEEILGEEGNGEEYIKGVVLRPNGVHGLLDRLEALKTIRLLKPVTDGGEHLAYTIANILKKYKPYNYMDPTTKQCMSAMDKIIQLYKENKHGEDLVNDIKKVYQSEISPKAREYMRYCLEDLLK